MNFKDLKNAEIGTILIDEDDVERYFNGFNRVGDQVSTELVLAGDVMSWSEIEIEDWTIKPKEVETVELYEYLSRDGLIVFRTREQAKNSFGNYEPVPNGRKITINKENNEIISCEVVK